VNNIENIGRLAKRLDELSIRYETDRCVADLSTFKVGGVARLAIFPESTEHIAKAVRAADLLDVRIGIIGNASNILFGFDIFDGALIFTDRAGSAALDGETIYAEAGARLVTLTRLAKQNGLTGLEFAYGIPGAVGGSVYMNAGAFGGAMADVVEYTDAYDRTVGEMVRVYDHGFGYRDSIYMRNKDLVCLGACLRFEYGDPEAIHAKMQENITVRREKQPTDLPSAGSYFKRPEGYFAGKLIEDAGLKGLRIGGAQVSEKHAGFIVNVGGATAGDILALEEKVKEEVLRRFGVELEREVRLIR